MKYWEMIADSLRREGWSVGWFRFFDAKRSCLLWSADAAGNGRRLIVQAEELAAAFLELEEQCRAASSQSNCKNAGSGRIDRPPA